MQDPTNLQEFLDQWRNTDESVRTFIKEVPPSFFDTKNGEKWSVGGHFLHMIKSLKAVAKALNGPKLVLKTFGKPNRPSRTYSGTRERYQQKLAEVTGPIKTKFNEVEGEPLDQAKLLTSWVKYADLLKKGIGKWEEDKVDAFLMPHPLLGKLTVREMLFFTDFHSLHHLNSMRETLKQVTP